MIDAIIKRIWPYLDRAFLRKDRSEVRRSKGILHIPHSAMRRGGKASYAEWGHVIGIFQTLMNLHSPKRGDAHVLDIGCGTGLMGLAAWPLVQEGGSYTGLDVIQSDVDYCKSHYPFEQYTFLHFDVSNPSYAPDQSPEPKPWPLKDNQYDLVTALSVWTHFRESDSRYYLKEVKRVLKPGGTAIITFFHTDEAYRKTVEKRQRNVSGKYHQTPQHKWIFSESAYGSEHWTCPSWVAHPEDAIGIDETGMDSLLKEAELELVTAYPGNWKEQPGMYFQDVLVLRA